MNREQLQARIDKDRERELRGWEGIHRASGRKLDLIGLNGFMDRIERRHEENIRLAIELAKEESR